MNYEKKFILKELLLQYCLISIDDGSTYIGKLLTFDNLTNITLYNAHKLDYLEDGTLSYRKLGGLVIRGNHVKSIGKLKKVPSRFQ